MKIATVKSLAAKLAITSLAVGAFFLASPAKSQAQQFAVGVQFGHPTYVADRDDYREHEQREAYARQQAYIAHERWEADQREAYARRSYYQHEQREHARDYDSHYGYR
jgi:hypothetical protein